MDFTATTTGGITKTITVPDTGQPRDELAPVAARAFQAYLAQLPATPPPGATSTTTAPAPAPDNGFANDLGSGIHSLETGTRATSRLLGDSLPDWVPGKQALQDFGGATPVTSAPSGGYQDASGRLGGDLQQGNYSQALSDLPHAALQAAPSMLGAIGAGAVGGAIGNAPGAAAGIAAFTGATSAGDNVAARAANNGRTLDTASGGDIAGGLATTGLQAAGSVVGLRPGLIPVVGSLIGKAGPIVRGAADVGADALAGAGNSVVGQAGDSAGTDHGLTVDPYTAAAAGLTAGAARAGTMTGRAAKAGAVAAANAVDAIGYDAPTDVSTAQRDVAVHQAVLARKAQDSASGRAVSYSDAAASLRTEQQANLAQTGRALAGQMAPEDATAFRSDYAALLDLAASPGKSLGPGGKDGPTTAFDRVQEWPIPDSYKAGIQDGMLSLDVLSQAARPSSAPGPAQKVLGLVGKGVGIAGGAYAGGVQGAIDGVLGAPIAGHIGNAVGRGIDTALGLSSAPPVIKARLAAGYLNKQGVTDAAPNPLQSSNDLLATVRDPQNSIAAALPPDPGAPTLQPATANSPAAMLTPAQMERGRVLNEQAANALQGQIYRRNQAVLAARADGVVGAPALAASQGPSALWQATGGLHGSPALPSDPRLSGPVTGPASTVLPVGLGQRGWGLSAAARDAQMRAQAANAAPATPALGAAQAASGQQGPTSAGVLGGGLQTYILRAAQSRGANHVTGHDVNAAVDDLVQTDKLDPRVGELIKSGANVPITTPDAQAVLAQTFHRTGLGNHLMDGSSLIDPNAPMPSPQMGPARPDGMPPARVPIQDIVRWQAAREDAKQHVREVAQTALAAGLGSAVPVIQAIGAVRTAEEKEKLRADYLATLKGKDAATAKALLASPALMRGV